VGITHHAEKRLIATYFCISTPLTAIRDSVHIQYRQLVECNIQFLFVVAYSAVCTVWFCGQLFLLLSTISL